MKDLEVVVSPQGYGLQLPDWRRVVWGEPENGLLGRVPTALYHALRVEFDSSLAVLWNTGATTKDGLSEARWTRQFTLMNLEELVHFKSPATGFPYFDSSDVEELRVLITDCSIIEEHSKNTSTSLLEALPLLEPQKTLRQVILVSSANHIQRCLRDAQMAWEGVIPFPCIVGVPADTCYGEATLKDLTIDERKK